MEPTTQLAPVASSSLAHSQQRTASEVRAQVNLIQEVMQAVMKDGTHYGKIPGTDKPTLFKAGSEKILSTFHIGVDPLVEDLSTPDEARYRVRARAFHQQTGVDLGAGVGEASSNEEKYRWREVVCDEEWSETPEDRRRTKWKRGQKGGYAVRQVRTNHADVANTVLKMAKKRAQIDMTLTVTAASDVFAQDIEDLPEEIRSEIASDEAPKVDAKPPIAPPQRKSQAAPAAAPARNASGPTINDGQAKRMFAIAMKAGWTKDDYRAALKREFGVDRDTELPAARYEEAVKFFEEAGQ